MLNAFRHQRSVHAGRTSRCRTNNAGAQRLSASKICSLLSRPGSKRRMSGAQRLSASKICSLSSSFSTAAVRAPCSTPFGIKDLFTMPGVHILLATDVLNAFRHQRSVHGPYFLHSLTDEIGAQRLSASKICSQKDCSHKRGQYPVLNAFRHQRSVHWNTQGK